MYKAFLIIILINITFFGCSKNESSNTDYSLEFTKDTTSVYYAGKKIEGADPNTFEILESWACKYAKDKNNVYITDDDMMPLTKITDVDPQTFVILKYQSPFDPLYYKKESCYGKDKNNVYYKNKKITGVDMETFHPYQETYFHPNLMDGQYLLSIDKNTFYLNDKPYIKPDGNKAIISGELLKIFCPNIKNQTSYSKEKIEYKFSCDI